jgi:uncharacterized membrane protein YgcG
LKNLMTKMTPARNGRAARVMLAMPLLILFAALILFHPMAVSAASSETTYHDSDPDDYITTQFDVRAEAAENHTVHYTETITVDFIQQHHGITRYIPEAPETYRIENVTCNREEYSVESEDGDTRIRVGDRYTFLTGKQTYEISYDLVYRKDDSASADALSLDLLPTGWGTSIREATMELTMPKEVDPDSWRIYSGSYGDSARLSGSEAEISEDGRVIRISRSDLGKGTGVTAEAILPEGYWTGAPNWLTFNRVWPVILIVLAGTIVLLYFLFHRKREVVPTVEFYPPDDLTPAEIAYVANGSVNVTDIASMFLYFAAKGYLKIHEYKKNQYELICVRHPDPTEKPFAIQLFEGMFQLSQYSVEETPAVRVGAKSESLSDAVTTALEMVNDQFHQKDHRVYRGSSRFARGMIAILTIAVLVTVTAGRPAAAVQSGFWAAYRSLRFLFGFVECALLCVGEGFLCSAYDRRYTDTRLKLKSQTTAGMALCVIAAAMGFFMAAGMFLDPAIMDAASVRIGVKSILAGIGTAAVVAAGVIGAIRVRSFTEHGADIYGKVIGFRQFIYDAEYARMKLLSDENPEYFYQILPYAYVLGMHTRFAKKFVKIPVPDSEYFDVQYGLAGGGSPSMYGMLAARFGRACNSAVAPKIDSGGGSFDGGGFTGGFTGGGGGGGGGGAW